ncbi:MAG: hypothetical protein GC162_20900 [Planctomycetes bacterium]|nr:hypothetical protein [Planctomycetota bacterium]
MPSHSAHTSPAPPLIGFKLDAAPATLIVMRLFAGVHMLAYLLFLATYAILHFNPASLQTAGGILIAPPLVAPARLVIGFTTPVFLIALCHLLVLHHRRPAALVPGSLAGAALALYWLPLLQNSFTTNPSAALTPYWPLLPCLPILIWTLCEIWLNSTSSS